MSADFSGALQKVGGKVIKQKQTRWFEIHGCTLVYYKARPAAGEKPQGSIDLRNTKCVESSADKVGFTITGPQLPKQYVLFAATEAERKQWMDKLEVAGRTGGPAPNVPTSSGADSDDEGGETDAVQVYNKVAEEGGVRKKVGPQDFEPIAVIGKGAFGKVMKVKKKDTGEIFAMKALSKDIIEKENLIEHTMAEKSILQRVQHPFIVTLHYAFQTNDKLFLILDFLSGGEIFFHLQNCNKFDEWRAKFYAAEVGLAVGHLHAMNVIYRDLKPENIVLDRYGHCCLTDFGLAKTNIVGATAQTFCGTPEYLAPEFLMGGGHGKPVDWWSLGILVYEMLAGIPPFYSENVNEMYELILQKPLEFTEEFSPEAQDLCKRLLNRDPAQRMQSIDQYKAHPFFKDIDWGKMLRREITPPFVPNPDETYCDPDVLQERVHMPDGKGDQHSAYPDFTFQGDKSALESAGKK